MSRLEDRVEEELLLTGEPYVREYQFGPYKADFALPHYKLLIEVDGTPHKSRSAAKHDAIKNKYYRQAGWEYLRMRWGLVENRTELRKHLRGEISNIKHQASATQKI